MSCAEGVPAPQQEAVAAPAKPKKTKLRLEVAVSDTHTILVPVLKNSTVGALKHSALSRATTQGLLPPQISQADLNKARFYTDKNVVLYEGDTLEDAGIEDGQAFRMGWAVRGKAGPQWFCCEEGQSVPATAPPDVGTEPATRSQGEASRTVPTGAENRQQPDAIAAMDADVAAVLVPEMLDEAVARKLCDEESLERRLHAEYNRMDFADLMKEHDSALVDVVRAPLNTIRLKLGDRALYAPDDVQRTVARVAIEKLDAVLDNPTAGLPEMATARRHAEAALAASTAACDEADRVELLLEGQASEERRKGIAVEKLEEYLKAIRFEAGIPDDLWATAEDLVRRVESNIILQKSLTRKELQASVEECEQFLQLVK